MNEQESNQFLEQLNAIASENEHLKHQIGKTSIFNSNQNNNGIQWRLDLSEELEKIEHVLRGDILTRDEQGQEKWIEQKDERLRPFNEYGVQLALKPILFYVNKHIIMGDYEEEQINGKMLNFGNEFARLIYLCHNEMGMNTDEKKRLYGMIIREVVDIVHASYIRAKDGQERIITGRSHNVSENISNIGMRQIPTAKKTSMLNPLGWFRS